MTEHIKMPEVAPLVRYLANGQNTIFTYPFPIFATEDLVIKFDGVTQNTGFDVDDVGQTTGGTVAFDSAPATGVVVTLQRVLPLERMTDFIEGGDFSARAINNELDYLTASIQQVSRAQTAMLRFDEGEAPSLTDLPSKALRAGKALGFDGNGNPVALPIDGIGPETEFTAPGTGAVTRAVADKLDDAISVKDFGAVGDGLTDDTLAIQKALTAHANIYMPSGIYIVSAPITLAEDQVLSGAGSSTVIQANSDDFTVIEMVAGNAALKSLKIAQGETGLKLYGRDAPCVANLIEDIVFEGQDTGIILDGYTDPAKPCYWNRFRNVLIAMPAENGVHLTTSGAGDRPSANIFETCRVYSQAADISGSGIYVENGAACNMFLNCEANVKDTATACVLIGADSECTILMNLFTLSSNLVPNVKLEAGSTKTAISNLYAASNGAAIWDFSGGDYTASNAGYPYKNSLKATQVSDLQTGLQRFEHEYRDATGTLDLDLNVSVYFLSSYNGALTVRLPDPGDFDGAEVMIKKIDNSTNTIRVTDISGGGLDTHDVYLSAEHDYVVAVSNGAEWFIMSASRTIGSNKYYDTTGTIEIDLAHDVYILSSYNGALTVQLPPANAAQSYGRTVTLKKTDTSSNPVTVTELGGGGPDQSSQVLDSRYEAVTVFSDGAQWYVISRL